MKVWGNNTTVAARIVAGLFLLPPFLASLAQTNPAPFELPELKIRLWHGEVQVRGALGYKDNVTLSSTDPHGSAFWSSGIEALAFRLPSGGWQFNAFLDAVDIRYFDSPSVDNEQQLVAVAELGRELGCEWRSALGLSYLFQNQVFDLTATYTNATAIGQVVGHTLTPRWTVRKEMKPFWVEAEWAATRQILEDPYDSYWQFSPRLTLGRHLGRRSELSLAYQCARLEYDSREQVDEAGLALPDTSLALQSHLAELAWTQTWDAAQHWRTTTRAGYERVMDNGSGFYDYDNYRLTGELRYRRNKWEVRARARLSHYDYRTQPLSADDPERRRKTLALLGLMVERQLGKKLKFFAGYSWERSLSNLAFDDYRANIVTAGLAATF